MPEQKARLCPRQIKRSSRDGETIESKVENQLRDRSLIRDRLYFIQLYISIFGPNKSIGYDFIHAISFKN